VIVPPAASTQPTSRESAGGDGDKRP